MLALYFLKMGLIGLGSYFLFQVFKSFVLNVCSILLNVSLFYLFIYFLHLLRLLCGEGNGNPLQCSCLENPRDGESGGLPSMGLHRVGHD